MEAKKLSPQENNLQQNISGGQKKSYLWIGLIGLVVLGGVVIFAVQNSLNSGKSSSTSVQAAPTKVWKIGVLINKDTTFSQFSAFKEKMVELGHEEGKDIEYTIKNAKGDLEVSKIHVAEFLAEKKMDILYSPDNTYKAFDRSTLLDGSLSIPTVFSNVGSFENMGLSGEYTQKLNYGLNFSGVMCGNIEFHGRRMELLKEIVPDAKVFGVLLLVDQVGYARSKKILQDAAVALGIELNIIEDTRANEAQAVEKAKREFTKDTIDGFLRSNGKSSALKVELAKHFVEIGVPAITWSHTDPVVPNYIVSHANNPPEQARQGASMVHKIMSGVMVDEIPIEFTTGIEIHLNTAIAKKAGIEIPIDVLLQAAIINDKL